MNDFLTLDPDGRVADHEGKTLDYKRDLSGPEGVLRTVVAFANSAGGRLVIGVADDRSVVGIDDPVTTEMRLANLIADSIRPQLLPTIELITLDGRTVLVANVTVGGQRPYYLKEAGRYGGAYVRLGSSNRRATRLLTDDLARGGRARGPSIGRSTRRPISTTSTRWCWNGFSAGPSERRNCSPWNWSDARTGVCARPTRACSSPAPVLSASSPTRGCSAADSAAATGSTSSTRRMCAARSPSPSTRSCPYL